jgi:hypothetical protein
MSNKMTFTVEGIAKLNVDQVKQAVDQMKTGFQGIKLPAGIDKNISGIFTKLNDEIAEFEVRSKEATTNNDWSKVIKSGQNILGLYQKLKGQVKQLGDLSEDQMKELFPPEVVANTKKAQKALADYEKAVADLAKKEKDLQAVRDGNKSKKGSITKEKNNLTKQKDAMTAVVEAQKKLNEAKDAQGQ